MSILLSGGDICSGVAVYCPYSLDILSGGNRTWVLGGAERNIVVQIEHHYCNNRQTILTALNAVLGPLDKVTPALQKFAENLFVEF